VTITTTGPAVAAALLSAKSLASGVFGGGAWLVASGVFSLFGLLRAAYRRRRVGRLFSIAGLKAVLLRLGSCGDGGGRHDDPGTPPGTYRVVLSATSDALTHPVNFTLVAH